MEFTNEIFFDKKLVQNQNVLITYAGKLYKEFSSEITIVYGFGENWDYTQETKMQETENGFQALITLKNYDTFNFCFKNNYNVWDNNSGFNYISSIDLEQQENVELIDEKNAQETVEGEDTIVVSSNYKKAIQNNDDELEQAFSDLLDSILAFEKTDNTAENINEDINLENGFGLQSVDEIKETDFADSDNMFQNLYNELAEIDPNTTEENNVENIETIADSEETKSTTADLETLLNDLNNKQEAEHKIINAQELDELMENILNSIIESDTEKVEKNSSLPVVQGNADNFLDKCIDTTYDLLRSFWKACKKIGALIKQKAIDLLGEEK